MCEERTKLLRMMNSRGVGFKEEESFLIHEMKKLKGNNNRKANYWKDRREILALLMTRKLRDNILLEKDLRMKRDRARRNMSEALGPNSTACRKIVRRSKEEGVRLRMNCKSKNEAKLKFLVNKYDVRHD